MRDLRADFPIFSERNVSYLDSAATSQRPAAVIAAEEEFYKRHNANPLRGLYDLSVEATGAVEGAREAVRRFIGAARAEEIIFTRNTTESLNLVAYSYAMERLRPGDEILVSIAEHHSNLLPWQTAARKTGATLRFMECEPDGSFDTEKIRAQINEKTRLVAMTQVSNVLGRVNPVKEVCRMAHSVGAVAVIDGAQSTPHMPVDVWEIGADFFAFSGHKLYGPMGIGVLYGRYELLDAMPPFMTGGEMIDSVSRYDAVFSELPHRLEAGTVNAAGAVGLRAAIEYVEGIGFPEIERLESEVTKYTFEKMKAIPRVHILGSDKAEEHRGIITFTVEGVHPHDIGEIMASEGVCVRAGHHCAQPLLNFLGCRSSVRASFAFYNTREDADRFLSVLSTVRERMGYAD